MTEKALAIPLTELGESHTKTKREHALTKQKWSKRNGKMASTVQGAGAELERNYSSSAGTWRNDRLRKRSGWNWSRMMPIFSSRRSVHSTWDCFLFTGRPSLVDIAGCHEKGKIKFDRETVFLRWPRHELKQHSWSWTGSPFPNILFRSTTPRSTRIS